MHVKCALIYNIKFERIICDYLYRSIGLLGFVQAQTCFKLFSLTIESYRE